MALCGYAFETICHMLAMVRHGVDVIVTYTNVHTYLVYVLIAG